MCSLISSWAHHQWGAHLLQAIDRRERLRRLALETIDLSKDPYFMRNHLGQARASPAVCAHLQDLQPPD